MASLDQLVHQLARPHKTMIERDGGQRELVDVLPLLQQLRYACRQDSRGGASGHSTGPSAPIAIQAVMDYRELAGTIQEWHVAITGQAYGSVEQQLIAWAHWVQSPIVAAAEPERAVECQAYLAKWVGKIETMLHPVRKGEIPGACPECTAAEAWENVDGERTRIGHAIITQGGAARCLNCGTTWEGKSLHALAAALKTSAARTRSALHLQSVAV
ncbi:DUF7341 domain-containing protein [Arthrobacter sp. SAFR-014]|uniref:DUF7341 domain-containing protein n=1 Tax=unclassified Arthrobacter TaxID=235627 RepID=UPI003F7B5AB9